MKELFILGAGASYDFVSPYRATGKHGEPFHHPLPLANNFFQRAIEYSVFKESSVSLIQYLERQYRTSFGDLQGGKSLNVEDIFIGIDNFLANEDQDGWWDVARARWDLKDIIFELLARLVTNHAVCQNHLKLAG